MHELKHYQSLFSEYLNSFDTEKEPKGLYKPVSYILQLGGKRLRPVLTLMSCDCFGGHTEDALAAATCIEVFHNFTLVHDDIMDEAPLRRGHETVHKKWDLNTGILSGDAMLILAYQCLEDYSPSLLKPLLKSFNKTALEICEGQQYDVDFETRNDVSLDEYLKMIKFKTAVLVGTALRFGAIIAGANEADQDLIEEFGINLGLAFQIQDDYLDAFGDPKSFGKQVGGDIIENKKTFLYLKSIELMENPDELIGLFTKETSDKLEKVDKVKSIFTASGADRVTKTEIRKYTDKAFAILDQLSISDSSKSYFKAFGEQLMNRTY